ncbi:MAG: DnaJ domain-containing protein [Acidobacteria bacterium]|nr:DnaJ domain-containing protein [Acidobacteriota bacterium]
MGKIGIRELFGLIKNIYLNRETGLLVCNFRAGKRLICFVNGNIRYARSGVEGEKLGEFLVKNGYLEKKELERHLSQAHAAGERFGRYLCDNGIVGEADIKETVKKMIQHIVMRPFFEEIDEINFEKKQISLDPALMLEISTGNILLECIRDLDNPAFIENVFEENKDCIPSFMDNPMLLFQKISLTPEEGFIFSRIDGHLSMGDIEKIAGMSRDRFVKILYGLHLIGLIDFSQSQDSSFYEEARKEVMENIMEQAEEPEATEAVPELTEKQQNFVREVKSFYKDLDNVNFYQLLDVAQEEEISQIKRNYYKLMKRYHPDRFTGKQYAEISGMLDEIVSRLTEAFQILKDEDGRKAYDMKLKKQEKEPPREAEGRTTSKSEIAFRDALFYISQARFSEAIEMLNRCIQLNPDDARYYLELGKLQVDNPMWAKRAEWNLQKALELNPSLLECYELLGRLCAKTGRRESAAKFFAGALTLDPENKVAIEGMNTLKKGNRKNGGFISKISDLFS